MKTGHERNQKSLNCLFNSKQSIKSAADTIHCVYLSDITPTEWTKDMALAAIKNSVTNYGYYEYNGKKGFCIVGDFNDIYNFIESVGHVVDEDNLYHWKEFPWDDAKKLDKRYSGQDYWNGKELTNSRRLIKSEYEDEDDSEVTEFYVSLGECGYDGTITVTKEEDGKWHGEDGAVFMGYLTPEEVVEWYDKDYGCAWLCNSRRPIKSGYAIVGIKMKSDGTLDYGYWNESDKKFVKNPKNCTEYISKDSAKYELEHYVPSKYDTKFNYFDIKDLHRIPY